ncbi:MAG: chemotaxis-specific protein-glutamate methyltransferase CheB [Magnetococcales bacterium]|nr:chemotaxis-specific protein-glutamate methyltransferase CheB [Magnetococcales bacterium]
MIRVLIVDDSFFIRQLLRLLLEDAGGIEVVGEAANGRQAVDMARSLRPDLITMDLEMPVMGGIEAIEQIMCVKAIPILVVSSVADARVALEAMQMGALEVVEKPVAIPESASWFVDKVRLLAGVPVVTRMRQTRTSKPAWPPPATHDLWSGFGSPRVFAIASSTGGPQALARILPALPLGFSCPVVIAQHISDGFARGIVEWLGNICALPVRLAADGEPLQAGVVYVSPSESHLIVTSARRMALAPRASGDIYRPSCDQLLRSVGEVFGPRAIGIILTGMGSDGASGIVRIHEKGGLTMAQDEGSSLIFGMNQVAIQTGTVHRILPVDLISLEMIRLANAEQGPGEIGGPP